MSISLGGLASKLDTQGMISKLMELDQIPYKNLEHKKSNLAAEQNVFRAINTKISALKTAMADLKLASTFKQTSAKSSDETVVRVASGDNSPAGTYNVEVTQIAKAHSISLRAVGDLTGKSFTLGTTTIDIDQVITDSGFDFNAAEHNGKYNDPTAKNNKILELVRDHVNKGDFNATASIVQLDEAGNHRLVLTAKETGTANKITFGAGDTGFISSTTQAAENAVIKVNGIEVTRSTNEFKDVIQGATLNVSKTGNSSITIGADTDKVVAKVEAFVNAYNDLISAVRENLKPPLDKTKVNPLQGDSVLKQISDQAYRAISDIIGSDPSSNNFARFLSDIGLEIDKGITVPSQMTGKIVFNKEQFKKKLEQDPNAVVALFNHPNESGNPYDPTAGAISRLDDIIKTWTSTVNGSITTKIKGYDSEISIVDDRMERMSNQIDQKYERLKKQYTAMEVALSKLQSQQSWLTGQISMLTAAAAQK